MTWVIDHDAVLALLREYGVKTPVRVRQTNAIPCERGFATVAGLCGSPGADGIMPVWVLAGLDADHANETLLHELAHCIQKDSIGYDDADLLYGRMLRLYGYDNHPIERAADKFAHDNRHRRVVKAAA